MTALSIRLVVQQIQSQHGCRYSLFAYSTDYAFTHIELNSLDDVRNVLRSAIPDFDLGELNSPGGPGAQVLLTVGLKLREEQIQALGLEISPY